jgi:hypothetical protein
MLEHPRALWNFNNFKNEIDLQFVFDHPEIHWDWYVLSQLVPIEQILPNLDQDWHFDVVVKRCPKSVFDNPDFVNWPLKLIWYLS